jgi:peptidyl-prolyl cis-trans isomerase B (cyclophilin B)
MTTAIVFLSVLFPVKGWFGPDQAWNVTVKPPAGSAVRLVLTDFSGSTLDPAAGEKNEFDREAVADIKKLYPAMNLAGTYLLYAVPKDQDDISRFSGTPLVFTVREDHRRGAPSGPMVTRVEPLRYAIISTDAGDMTVAFYYGVAPNTIANFISLATERFYDDLTFHRVEPNFIIQGGDPRGDGTGGPGYNIDAEFSDRKQEKGVISMSRDVDPNESPNNPPRPEYANSAGSQFFISLDPTTERKSTGQLEGAYTVFAKVVGGDGFKTLDALAATKIADTKTARPLHPPVIKKIEIRPVTSRENPYLVLLAPVKAEIQVPKSSDVATGN